jgi:hypothetical protein
MLSLHDAREDIQQQQLGVRLIVLIRLVFPRWYDVCVLALYKDASWCESSRVESFLPFEISTTSKDKKQAIAGTCVAHHACSDGQPASQPLPGSGLALANDKKQHATHAPTLGFKPTITAAAQATRI